MPRPLIARPSLPAMRIAAGLFMLLFALGAFAFKPLLAWWQGVALDGVEASLPWRAWQLLQFLLPGVCAGYFARRAGAMHGALLGLLTLPALAVLVISGASGDVPGDGSWLQGAVSSLLWCAAGGQLGEWLARRGGRGTA